MTDGAVAPIDSMARITPAVRQRYDQIPFGCSHQFLKQCVEIVQMFKRFDAYHTVKAIFFKRQSFAGFQIQGDIRPAAKIHPGIGNPREQIAEGGFKAADIQNGVLQIAFESGPNEVAASDPGWKCCVFRLPFHDRHL
jgi:hypothetical protein